MNPLGRSLLVGGLVAGLLGVATYATQECCATSSSVEQHAWLRQLEGEWTAELESPGSPDAPATTKSGVERVRAIGELWTVSEINVATDDVPLIGVQTLGFDPKRAKFVGTWIDASSSHLWVYEGTLDAGGTKLTLEAEGPDLATPDRLARYRDVIEVKDADRRVVTSSIQRDDGAWNLCATIRYQRRK